LLTQWSRTSELPPLEARALLSHVLQVTPAWVVAHDEVTLDEISKHRLDVLADRRRQGEPMAYLVGEKEFWGMMFKVTPDVLIPRPDTETLVETALRYIPVAQEARVLDLGTGSGAVAIAIACERPYARLYATDISEAALCVAEENAARLLQREAGVVSVRAHTSSTLSPCVRGCPEGAGEGAGGEDDFSTFPSPPTPLPQGERGATRGAPLQKNVHMNQNRSDRIVWCLSDWFSAIPVPRQNSERFSVIVSNPPYIAAADAHLDEGDVRFEPRNALVGGRSGWEALQTIAQQAPMYLQPGGVLLMEHGYDQGDVTRALLRDAGFTQCETVCDLAGVPRVTLGVLTPIELMT
jgi:release factor glutamine methyltransferase